MQCANLEEPGQGPRLAGSSGADARAAAPGPGRPPWRDLFEELRELGVAGTAFRVRWELGLRSGWVARTERAPRPLPSPASAGAALVSRLPFAPAAEVRAALAGQVGPAARATLAARAADAEHGRIRCFGGWTADFGDPIDWFLNPSSGQRWDPSVHWSEILRDTGRAGDVKLTWEVGRFPQAYDLARAAAFRATPPARAAAALARQIEGFAAANPYGRSVHWASGQEIVIRLVAWLFAASVLRDEPAVQAVLPTVALHLYEGAVHLERYLDYARKAVYDNHLVSEAFGLYLAGALLPEAPRSRRWSELGMGLLTEQAARQVYPDGGYLMASHNYQRAALQTYLLALAVRRREGGELPPAWRACMARSLDFLVAQQDPADGRLPNLGNNDGALPAVLTGCDFSDYRPLLQALSLAARGARLYQAGPWDEEAAWLLGPAALEAPLEPPRRASVSFAHTGLHVLRGRAPGTFCSFRCGTVRDRFTQIDMLHLDVSWRGENVLVDAGSYLYSGPEAWLRHFTGGESHNTVTVDGRDQMVHHRRFKVLYPTRARLLRFEDAGAFAVVEGEHDGFRRHPGGCVHRRAVLFAKDDLWVVADRIAGAGRHAARLHWLGGAYPHSYSPASGALALETPAGRLTVTVLALDGRPLAGDVVAGGERPPRGWLSRCYGARIAVPSLVVTRVGAAPLELVSVIAAGFPRIQLDGTGQWRIEAGASRVAFRVREGRFEEVSAGQTSAGDPG